MSRPYLRYGKLSEDQQYNVFIGVWFVFLGLLRLLSSHPVVLALGFASLLGSIYFFFLVRAAGKQKRTLLHGRADERPLSDLENAPSGLVRDEENGRRFLMVLCVITLLWLVAHAWLLH